MIGKKVITLALTGLFITSMATVALALSENENVGTMQPIQLADNGMSGTASGGMSGGNDQVTMSGATSTAPATTTLSGSPVVSGPAAVSGSSTMSGSSSMSGSSTMSGASGTASTMSGAASSMSGSSSTDGSADTATGDDDY